MLARYWLRGPMLGIVVVTAVSVFGCGAGDVSGIGLFPDVPDLPISVRLDNTTGSAAHLFWENETFPCCGVEPGSSRTVLLPGLTIGSIVDFSAGVDGQVVASVRCEFAGNFPLAVVFSAPQQLTCQGW